MAYFYKENPALEAQINEYFKRLSDYNDEAFGGALSLILLGSLSRGEATWTSDGGLRLLSDIEYFTVYPQGFNAFGEFEKFSQEAAKAVFGEGNSALFHIDNTFVLQDNLPKMERKLLTYDAKQIGKTVVGQDRVQCLPDIDAENINFCDIKDILTHRAFSMLYYGLPFKRSGQITEYRYCLAKNSLDLMTVMLLSNGLLASGFINRLKLVCDLPIQKRIKDYFSFCLSVKLSTDCEFDFSIEEMEEIFISLLKDLYKNFKIPVRNVFINKKFVIRRILGMTKRAIKYRHIPRFNHLPDLIKSYEKEMLLQERQRTNNLVINGYPKQ